MRLIRDKTFPSLFGACLELLLEREVHSCLILTECMSEVSDVFQRELLAGLCLDVYKQCTRTAIHCLVSCILHQYI